jgi:Xaa-Pro dipeptidase
LMKKAGELTDEGLRAAVAAIKEGTPEHEIIAAANFAMSSMGPGGLCIDCMAQSGENSEVLLKRPTERKIQKGDMILIDVAARYKMYAADVARGVVFAGTKEQEKIMEVAVTAFEAGLKSVKSGVRASDIYAVVREVIDKAGYGEYFKKSAGHGIGMDPEDEIPFIVARNEMIIQPNMTFCLKSAIMMPGQGGLRIEDVVVARETKAELLTTFERRLVLA